MAQQFNEDTKDPDEIFVTFTFQKNKKQIYIDVNKKKTLREALYILTDKYQWLLGIEKMGASLKGIRFKPSDLNKSLNQLGIDENSDIDILTDQEADLFADAKERVKREQQKEQNQQINNPNFNQLNNFPNVNNFNNFPINKFQFNQNQGFNNFNMQNNQPQNNMNMNNMQNNVQNQPFYGSSRLKEIYTFLKEKGFCSNQNENRQLINFLNYLLQNNYVFDIPYKNNNANNVWKNFYDCRNSKNKDFKEAVYRISHLFANIDPNVFLKIFANNTIGFNIGQYAQQRKYPLGSNNGPFIPLNNKNRLQECFKQNNNMNNQIMMKQNNMINQNKKNMNNMNQNNMINQNKMNMMNNMQNNVQNQHFCKSDKLRAIFNYLTSNGFCLPNYKDRDQLINFLNNLYTTGIYDHIPTDTQNPTVWTAFKNVKHNNRHYLEAVYRISYLFPQIKDENMLSKFLKCAQIDSQTFINYGDSRRNKQNNQNMNVNNNMNMMNNQMMNQNNMNNNLFNGFWQGDWFTWDKRPIETLINAAGIKVDKYTLYNHICKSLHEIDAKLRQPDIYNKREKYYKYINLYNQALRFLSLYFADIIEKLDLTHYSYYFKKYNFMYRFVPQYIDPDNQQRGIVSGKVSFYDPISKNYQEIPLTELDNTNDLPGICKNIGATCYANACRNMLLSNKMLKAVLSRIGGDLLGSNPDANDIITNVMQHPEVPTGNLCDKDKNKIGGCQNPYPNEKQACACKLSKHAKRLVKYARDRKWGIFEMLCLYSKCTEFAVDIADAKKRVEFLTHIFEAVMVITGDQEALYRKAEANGENDLRRDLDFKIIGKLGQHPEFNEVTPVPGTLAAGALLGRSLYGSYQMSHKSYPELAIPGKEVWKLSVLQCQRGHRKYDMQAYYPNMAPLCTLRMPNQATTNGGIYDMQAVLGLNNSYDIFNGENKCDCDQCRMSVDQCRIETELTSNPLSYLELNYGMHLECKNRIRVPEYVVNCNVPPMRATEVYQLRGFVQLQGQSGAGGHFVSYHKVPSRGNPPYQWYCCNDDLLYPVPANQVQEILLKPTVGGGSTITLAHYERVPITLMYQDWPAINSIQFVRGTSNESIKLTDPLYAPFYDPTQASYGEPNPNNPYTAVLGLQHLLTNLGLGHLINPQQKQNVPNQYMTWNTKTNCAVYNNNLNWVQPMNNMFMNHPMHLNNKVVNVNNMPFNQQGFK